MQKKNALTETTNNKVKIGIETLYLPELSNEKKKLFAFGYFIKIKNLHSVQIQLLARKWTIEDANEKKKK